MCREAHAYLKRNPEKRNPDRSAAAQLRKPDE